MRLIDADKILEELNSFSMRITGSANALALSVMYETKKSIAKMIDEQPTAYDVDKVVEKLKQRSFPFVDDPNDRDVDLDEAIKIVKSGAIDGH